MLEFLSSYGMFVLETLTLALAVIITFGIILGIIAKSRQDKNQEKQLKIVKLNDSLEELQERVKQSILDPAAFKKERKQKQKAKKAEAKQKKKQSPEESPRPKRIFVIDFKADIKASQVAQLREEITAILSVAQDEDEVVALIESPGGMATGYGLAAAQFERIRQRGLYMTACVDMVAASGGYLVACVAQQIIASRFAIVGSIGVVAQVPNAHKFLKKRDIEVEVLTAGKYKRTLTIFGKNTPEGRKKFIENLNVTHELFQNFVAQQRPQVDLAQVATGEYWHATDALEKGLIDKISTSDAYLIARTQEEHTEVYLIKQHTKKSLAQRFGKASASLLDQLRSNTSTATNSTNQIDRIHAQ